MSDKKRILLHTCCAPCSLYPVKILNEKQFDITLLFHNPYIHPYSEYEKRLNAFKEYYEKTDYRTIILNEYDIVHFVRESAFREDRRCALCYAKRIETAAKTAKKGKYDAFTTTLLYSKMQNHSLIRQIAENISKEIGIDFFYYDFREGWSYGIEESKRLNIYRQQYCGCIYSEAERYYKPMKKML